LLNYLHILFCEVFAVTSTSSSIDFEYTNVWCLSRIQYNQHMLNHYQLDGVYAAAITPLSNNKSVDLDWVPVYLSFLARRGCHGALILGTTGEGPSFAHAERVLMMKAALAVRQEYPEYRLLAGTGTPSLEETVQNTRAAFDLGFDGVVILPPYYFRKVSDDGLFAWFSEVILKAVPESGAVFGYHFPSVSGVPLSIELLARLKDAFPYQFVGIKDSSGSLEHAVQLGERFGKDLISLIGNDRIFSQALAAHASGCITAMANICSPALRQIWDGFQRSEAYPEIQKLLNAGREVMDTYPPAPPLIKALASHRHNFPRWSVRPPLLDFPPEVEERAIAEMDAACYV
jgi:4-hydroxy-tetrahydrodipicolinate synthase